MKKCFSNSTLLASGECDCEPGFGGESCDRPIGGNPLKPREGDCDANWEGLTCRVCNNNTACAIYQYIQPTCWETLHPVRQNYANCKVTNKAIVDTSPQKLTAVWTCNPKDCHLEFLFDKEESFWCQLKDCVHSLDKIECAKVKCQCIPGHELCGKTLINLSEFLETKVVGPAQLTREPNTDHFEFYEPHLEELLMPMFGEKAFNLDCNLGECVDHWEVVQSPINRNVKFTLVPLAILSLLALGILVYCINKTRKLRDYLILNSDDHISEGVGLSFFNIEYIFKEKKILKNCKGHISKGELCAIMGPSGAGKSTLLEILANRFKKGEINGHIFADGKPINLESYRDIIGYVEQDDYLMNYLTVEETITYSALLRLPRDMALDIKQQRVQEVMKELGIEDIKDQYIGGHGLRGISGGERRRVSIACELVKNPLILFLDEPTSGLDSFNAMNVVECLHRLSRDYKRTIIMSIHQPRSSIFQLFDKIILLAKGQCVYSGKRQEINSYFDKLGHNCPTGYNIADYLVDLITANDTSALVNDFNASTDSKVILHNISLNTGISFDSDDTRSIASHVFMSNAKPSLFTQLMILSDRTLKNLIRNPLLLFAHYIVSVIVGLLLGCVYFHVTNDISGIQNRMGCFFFLCAIFGFSCLSTLNVLHRERQLFIKEQSNRFYDPSMYFISKVLFDIIPLRVVPPILVSIVLYPLVGLRKDIWIYLKFLLSLISFNITSSSICFFIGIVFADLSVSTLITALVMLTSMLFSGLLLNTRILYLYR